MFKKQQEKTQCHKVLFKRIMEVAAEMKSLGIDAFRFHLEEKKVSFFIFKFKGVLRSIN